MQKTMAVTVRVGNHSHDRTITVGSEGDYKHDIFTIARMVVRWRNERANALECVRITTEGRPPVRIHNSGNAERLARRIRRTFCSLGVTSFA